jgi:glycosyltransferase involved in cell wall biosynthesis
LRVLSVGRLAHQKGYDILVDALALLPPEAARRLQVEIAGDGPLRGELEARAGKLAPGMLRFLGELDSAAVARRLEQSDVFLLSSRYEGMSNAALEAMERGLPLLVTRCGGIDTYLGEDAGWVVPPGSASELAQALGQVLALPDAALERAGRASRALVEREFSMGGVAARYVQLFRELIDASGRGRPQLQ